MSKFASFLTRIASAALIAGLAFVAPAQAQTYIGISGGASIQSKSDNEGVFTTTVPPVVTPALGAIPSGTSLGWQTKFDKGYNISAMIGNRFDNGFRVEAQVSYTRNGVKNHSGVTVGGSNIDNFDAAVLTRGAPLGVTVGTVVNSGIGKTQNLAAFGNAYYDFNKDGKFQPYVGGGVGISSNKVDFRPSDVDVGQGKKTKFAYQLMAGATYKVGSKLELFGQYSYRDNGKTKIALDLLPADLTVKSRQSLFSLGVRIPLGGGE
jgi:opacity protein-like surface antigen